GDDDCNYAIVDRDGRYLGGCGIAQRVGPGAVDLGYWVSVEHTRRGIAAEAARMLTTAAFEEPSVARVEIHCDEANVASAAVARHNGFVHVRTDDKPIDAPGQTGRSMIWVMTRERWNEQQLAQR